MLLNGMQATNNETLKIIAMDYQNREKVRLLIEKGVKIPNPLSVDIGEEVDIARISGDGVVIHAGCKVYGKKTLIMSGTRLGYEGPATIEDCHIGPNVELKGGSFCNSVFLQDANMGYGAEVRDACILEEQANGAHVVGLKHTILFPFVTLGSLINFCDCLMAGGTSRRNHSEVGSSYIHFNYTPNQDKATPSLIGDVPRGVMLNQSPIFLGGQGGLVGPSRLGYGSVIAAGVIYRGDCPEGEKLLIDGRGKKTDSAFYPGLYYNIARRTLNNIHYIANLIALRQWYLGVRFQFFQEDSMNRELYEGALGKLDMAIDERINRLKALAYKMPQSAKLYQRIMKGKGSQRLVKQKKELFDKWNEIEDVLSSLREKVGEVSDRDAFLETVVQGREEKGNDYIKVIQGLDRKSYARGTTWLQDIVDEINRKVLEKIPSFKDQA
jgi:bifunctional UDP-N-acetylglucosamine pyrophosphorylase/glucosamine-1-phosphate N-acetyltransferase